MVSNDLEWQWKNISATASFPKSKQLKNNANISQITIFKQSEVTSALPCLLLYYIWNSNGRASCTYFCNNAVNNKLIVMIFTEMLPTKFKTRCAFKNLSQLFRDWSTDSSVQSINNRQTRRQDNGSITTQTLTHWLNSSSWFLVRGNPSTRITGVSSEGCCSAFLRSSVTTSCKQLSRLQLMRQHHWNRLQAANYTYLSVNRIASYTELELGLPVFNS